MVLCCLAFAVLFWKIDWLILWPAVQQHRHDGKVLHFVYRCMVHNRVCFHMGCLQDLPICSSQVLPMATVLQDLLKDLPAIRLDMGKTRLGWAHRLVGMYLQTSLCTPPRATVRLGWVTQLFQEVPPVLRQALQQCPAISRWWLMGLRYPLQSTIRLPQTCSTVTRGQPACRRHHPSRWYSQAAWFLGRRTTRCSQAWSISLSTCKVSHCSFGKCRF